MTEEPERLNRLGIDFSNINTREEFTQWTIRARKALLSSETTKEDRSFIETFWFRIQSSFPADEIDV